LTNELFSDKKEIRHTSKEISRRKEKETKYVIEHISQTTDENENEIEKKIF
jgi:hypothetical protein